MNKIINYLSILAGKSFAASWHKGTNSWLTMRKLDIYVALRRQLPKVATKYDFNHWGNHHGSNFKPWRATQGLLPEQP